MVETHMKFVENCSSLCHFPGASTNLRFVPAVLAVNRIWIYSRFL